MRILPLQKLFTLAFFLGIAGFAFAQPSNDMCSSPTPMVLGANSSNCTPVNGDTRGTEDAQTVEGPVVCSGSWYADDVWFEFTTGAAIPPEGITVIANFDPNATATDVPFVGMAVYPAGDCSAANIPIECFSNGDGTENAILLPPQCLDPNASYLVRVWSGGDPVANAGTFTICAYGADPVDPPSDVVIWSEDFDNGIGDWTTNGISDSTHVWLWDADGVYFNAFGGTISLNSFETSCNGAMGFPSGWFQTGRTGDVADVPPGPPYPEIYGELISPSIDLSNEACASIKFTESFRGLNGANATRFGPFIDYSIDGGMTWIGGFDVSPEPDTEINIAYNGRDRVFPLVGVGGQSDVRIRFSFVGDFYYWIIDNVQLIQREDNNMRAQNNFYAIAPTVAMPLTQLDEMGFLIDIINLGCEAQENVSVNVNIVDDADGSVVFNEDLAYGTIDADSLAENVPFAGRWTPPAGVETTYTGTYTVSADADDEDPSDNVRTFNFATVNDLQFRKENGSDRTLQPSTAVGTFWEEGEVHSWEIGNAFYVVNGDDGAGNAFQFNSIDFLAGNPDQVGGEDIRVWLYRFEDVDQNGIIDKSDGSEISRIGLGEYTFTGFEDAATLINIPIEAFISPDDLILQAGTHYIASVEFPTQTVGVDFAVGASEAVDYSAQMYLSQEILMDPSKLRYSHIMGIGKEGTLRLRNTADITTTNFGDDIVPVIRLNYDGVTSTNDLSNDIAINVFPNPASTQVAVNLDLTETVADMTIQIMDVAGRTLSTRALNNVQNVNETFDVSTLTNGIYFMHVSTDLGIQTQRFVISK